MGRPGTWQIIVLLVIILLLFGAPKLPELARSVGQSLRILKDETKQLVKDDEASVEPEEDKAAAKKPAAKKAGTKQAGAKKPAAKKASDK